MNQLLDTLLCITDDNSSVAARQAVIALSTCLPQLIQSYHGNMAVKALLKLLQVKDNSYWLVKVIGLVTLVINKWLWGDNPIKIQGRIMILVHLLPFLSLSSIYKPSEPSYRKTINKNLTTSWQ